MKISNEQTIRPKFLAALLLFLAFMLILGGLYTIGLWLPMFVFSGLLFFTNKRNAIELFPVRFYQVACILTLALATFITVVWGVAFAISIYIMVFGLSFSFKVIRVILGYIGLVGLFTGA